MSNSLRYEWEECCAERDRALADLVAEKALREDWQRIGEARLAECEREKARADAAEAEHRKTSLFYNCGAEPPCEKCITCQWDDAREALAAEKARAEKADREYAVIKKALGVACKAGEQAESALAAARRECEVRQAAHRYCLYMFSREWLTDAANRNIFAAQIFKILDAALAAPAAGDSK